MKNIFLLLTILSLLFSLYFLYERADIFVEIFRGRPFNQIPLNELIKPTLLVALGFFFLYIFRKRPTKTQNNEK
ncbi:MAG: hypothetical protein U0Y10_10915 [Spirosomataceae bacterium]